MVFSWCKSYRMGELMKKKLLSSICVLSLLALSLSGCEDKTKVSENNKTSEVKEIVTCDEYGNEFNSETFEDGGISFNNLHLEYSSEKIVFSGHITNSTEETKEIQFAYTLYNDYGEKCPSIAGSKFTTYNYKLNPGEGIDFNDEVETTSDSSAYNNFVMLGVYGAQETAETISSSGVESAKSLSEYEVKAKVDDLLKEYNVLSVDVLHLTEGGLSVDIQIIADTDGENALSICKSLGKDISEFNSSYEISIVSNGQLIATYDSLGNEIIY